MVRKKDIPAKSLTISPSKRFVKNFVMVACCVSYKGTTPPFFCKKGLKINSESYCDLVLDNYAPYLQALYPEKNGLYFLQDGAPSHTSEESLKCVHKIFGAKNVIQNPPNSPDLNVLDYHTWDHMDKMVQQNKDIVTLSDLKREVVRSYQNVNMDEVRKSIESWPKRLEKCIEAGGDRFEFAL